MEGADETIRIVFVSASQDILKYLIREASGLLSVFSQLFLFKFACRTSVNSLQHKATHIQPRREFSHRVFD
jgi:hypothetical protein